MSDVNADKIKHSILKKMMNIIRNLLQNALILRSETFDYYYRLLLTSSYYTVG